MLVTGGLGALGMHVARWLWEEHRVAHIVLVSRSAPTSEKLAEIERLRSAGAKVTVAAIDVSNASAVQQLVASVPAEYPLRGIVHAAGMLDDGVLLEQNATRIAKVFAPKVRGAFNLHLATRTEPLDFFVMFSSVASIVGNAGQSNYAAANAFLDALAHARRAEGLPAQSLQWGAWAEGGMAAGLSEALQTRLSRMGLDALSSAQGLAMLGTALRHDEAELVTMRVDLSRLEQSFGNEIPPLWRAMFTPKARKGGARVGQGVWRDHLSRLSEQARVAEVGAAIREDVTKVLSLGSATEVPANRALQELGLDSLMAVEVRNALSARVGTRLPATLLFDYPTVRALQQYLLENVLVFNAPALVEVQPAKQLIATDEGIAIIGVGCRFPGGAQDSETFWRLLENEVDAIREVPKERWDIDAYYDPNPDAPGKMTTRWGGFLDELDRFDPSFFGISPREALSLDPQQRLLLETTWEALERAGIPVDRLMGSDIGVYVGICSNEYQQRTMANIDEIDPYSILGTAHSAIAGRISYWLGLQGPNLAVDTACSSSLVSIHLACRAIRSGECSMALAGGVNVVLSPENTVYFSRLKAMSPTGRCHTFSADADGYVRSEGCAMVVLKRLSEALRDGDPILAVIRGTAINQDGRSQGLTAPNGPAQEAVIRKALSAAGIRPADVDYVETHGTGTPLGDPIEVQALAKVLGEGRSTDNPLVIGSVKTNIGHTEGAAGVAGLLKAALSLEYESIPRTLHFTAPNPHIAWSELALRVANKRLPWRRNGKRRVAGVSSFGFSGTNAHVILEEAPVRADKPIHQASSYLLPLSAKTPEALVALAKSYSEWFVNADASFHDVVYTASLRRSHFEHRLGVVGTTKDEIAAGLRAFATGETSPNITAGKATPSAPKVVFVFPGQGSQWIGMGRQLYREEPAFRDALAACDEAIRKEAGFSIIEELHKPEETSRLGAIDVVQPLLFAIEIALAALWRAWGVEPSAVVGHSMGEVAAVFVAGMLSMQDAAAIICRRSRLLRKVSGQGAMALVELTLPDAENALIGYETRLSVAVSNGPRSTVIAGDPAALDEVLGKLEKDGVFCRRVKVDVASHSPQVDPLREDLLTELAAISPREGIVPMLSTVTGGRIRGDELEAMYWADNLRKPVLFSRVIEQWIADGHTVFVEMSPHPILTPSVEENLRALNVDGLALASVRRTQDERQTMLSSLGALYARGYPIAWSSFFPDGGRVVQLPTYPWQRARYWIDSRSAAQSRRLERIVSSDSADAELPLAGVPHTSSLDPDARCWRQSLSVSAIPWLGEHRVQGEVVFPGAGYVECVLEALGPSPVCLEDIAFEQLMTFTEGQMRDVEVVVRNDGPRKSFRISSQSERSSWVRNASGYIRPLDQQPTKSFEVPSVMAARLPEALDVHAYYEKLRARQLYHGPPFQGIAELRVGEREAVARLHLPQNVPVDGYVLHPALLDACFQVSGALYATSSDTFVPVGVERFHWHGHIGKHAWVVATKSASDEERCDLRVVDDAGQTLLFIEGLRLQRIDGASRSVSDALEGCVYEVAWRSAPSLSQPEFTNRDTWIVVVDRRGLGNRLTERLSHAGQRCVRLVLGSAYEIMAPNAIRIDGARPEDYRRFFKETFGEDEHCAGVVHLASLDVTPFDQSTAEHLSGDLVHAQVSATYLTQAMVRHGFRDAPRLFLVTRGAQSVHSTDPVSVAQASTLGLGKAIAMELSDLRCTRIDLPAEETEQDEASLWREVGHQGHEDEIALRGEARYVARLVRRRFENEDVADHQYALEPARGRAYRLEIRNPGALDRLALHEIVVPSPGPDEILIEVEAAGLNFLDVLAALGTLPPEATGANEFGPALGGECAGRIVAVGADVTNFGPGQSVIALGARAFGTHLLVRSALVAPQPARLTFEDAATMPIVFLTAYYALEYVGRLRKGERVLIHAGAGGVGLAAIQWALHVGAEVFATAGSEEKRAYLRSLGVAHVFDSRSLRFVDEIKRVTNGDGVDVVLNSLAGDFIPASLSLLRDYGRFIEIGKRDYFENKQIGLRPFLRNLSFSLVDLRGLTLQRPAQVGEMLRELLSFFDRGILRPLPVQVFPASRASDAFHHMAQSKHIGKIAVAMKDLGARIVPRVGARPIGIREDRTYLITGGLGGLGSTLAQWLVEQGARNLVLVGRKGPSEDAQSMIRALADKGARVHCMQADVSRKGDVEKLFATIRTDMPPLAGIVHAAMVLDDHTLLEQSEEAFQRVFAPKAWGAWHLHEQSKSAALDFFVMYSSAAGLLGSPGQSNYCAANAFLDAVCRERARCGLPAMSIQWGAFSEVGAAAATDIRAKRLAHRGGGSFTPAEGLDAFRRLLANPRPQVGVMRFDLRQWTEFYPGTAGAPFFAEIVKHETGRTKQESSATAFLERAQAAPPEERLALLEKHLLEHVSAVLRLDSSKVERTTPLQSLGLDSLMSLELRNRIERSLGLKLSATVLYTYSSIAALTEHLLGVLFGSSSAPVEATPSEDTQAELRASIEREVADLSEDGLLDELARELASD